MEWLDTKAKFFPELIVCGVLQSEIPGVRFSVDEGFSSLAFYFVLLGTCAGVQVWVRAYMHMCAFACGDQS